MDDSSLAAASASTIFANALTFFLRRKSGDWGGLTWERLHALGLELRVVDRVLLAAFGGMGALGGDLATAAASDKPEKASPRRI